MIDRTRLATALAASLQQRAPEGLTISSARDEVVLMLTEVGSRHLHTSLGGTTDEERLNIIAYHVLDALQDFISIERREPWPTPVSRGGQIPLPGSEVRAGTLRLYFGEPAQPAIEFPPIALADVIE